MTRKAELEPQHITCCVVIPSAPCFDLGCQLPASPSVAPSPLCPGISEPDETSDPTEAPTRWSPRCEARPAGHRVHWLRSRCSSPHVSSLLVKRKGLFLIFLALTKTASPQCPYMRNNLNHLKYKSYSFLQFSIDKTMNKSEMFEEKKITCFGPQLQLWASWMRNPRISSSSSKVTVTFMSNAAGGCNQMSQASGRSG